MIFPIQFEPAFESDGGVYRRLVRAASKGALFLSTQIDRERQQSRNPVAQFALSVLRDITSVGGHVWVRDSRLFVAWPDWSGEAGRTNARKALQNARDEESVRSIDFDRLRPLFLDDIPVEDLIRLGREGVFRLVPASEHHPSGRTYMEGFSAALRYWSMPYRGRTGRTVRFVLTVQHATLAPEPKIVGILELGDEAPFCTWRDELLGLTVDATEAWLLEGGPGAIRRAQARLKGIRSALKPLTSGLALGNLSAGDILDRKTEIERLAVGRSTVADDQHEMLYDRRRAIYALRLASGEAALQVFGSQQQPGDEQKRNLSSGIRSLRDLLVPRLHMEVTVCGALPPFSSLHGGKLIVSQFAHPMVVEAVQTPLGDLIGHTFYSEMLAKEIFSPGMVAITTKGLYPGHSPLYNRGTVPGRSEPRTLRKISETAGQTTTLMSKATAEAARRLVADNEGRGGPRVSNIYGSGGAKRHRLLEVAARTAGLSTDLINAGIRRPVYGIRFASNPEAVAWENAQPVWEINRDLDSTEYVAQSLELWRQRWLPKGQSRLGVQNTLPGLVSVMLRSAPIDD